MKSWTVAFAALIFGGTALAACGGSGSDAYGTFDAGQKKDVTTVLPHDSGVLRLGDSGGVSCNSLTCTALGYNCGVTGDGCGGMLDCGTCASPETCGGGGKFSVCGGAGPCKPKTCADLGVNCGPQGDGCGNLLQCGTCTAPDICGGGGKPSNCGTNGSPHPDGGLDGGPCVPKSCAEQGITCGPAGDGCGNTLSCGTCSGGQTCGGGGVNGQCGAQTKCVPTTCAALGFNCGPAADGCGGVLQCGSCTSPSICGGGGKPSVCGDTPACTGLCTTQQQTATQCGGTNTTTLSGTVVAGTLPMYIPASPAGLGPDPIPNVLVYVPNGTPAAFTTGVQCQPCGADVTGNPLIEATTDAQGNFTLTNVPVPSDGVIPLVIQLGRWRRIFGLGNSNNPGFNVTACQGNNVGSIRMPRNSGEGDIPLTAISTGAIDPMECVLLKMGVDQGEFRDPGAGGRIELYQGNGSALDSMTPPETSLVVDAPGGTGTLDNYDQVLFPCWAEDPLQMPAAQKTQNQLNDVVSYTGAGGRMFATHLSYSWLENIPTTGATTPFNATATWTGDPAALGGSDLEYDAGTAVIQNTASSDVQTFYDWMNGLAWNGASSGSFPVIAERNNFSQASAGTTLWIMATDAVPAISNGSGGDFPQQFPLVYVFGTPYQATTPPTITQCGKVIYSDFHVSVINGGLPYDNSVTFPNECTSDPMSAQEKALEYLIWDLAECVPGPPPPTCTPTTCAAQGITCGTAGDGCGNTLSCGSCTGCETCGGGGTPNQCGGTCCKPETCEAQNIECGPAGDGCGNSLNCGSCTSGLTCGGGGVNGKCGSIDAGPTCQPLTCKDQGITCGPAGDGCGNELQCGSCASGQECGAGGTPGVCAPVCVPTTCAKLGFNCGPTADGCGHELNCGTCVAPQTCGGGGKASVCGGAGVK
jgi:hypothetical protein